MIQIHNNQPPSHQDLFPITKVTVKTRLEKMEAEFKKLGGERNQLHNIYKVPTANKLISAQLRANERIRTIEHMYADKMESIENEKLNREDNSDVHNSLSLSEPTSALYANKNNLILEIKRDLANEINQILTQYRADIIRLLRTATLS